MRHVFAVAVMISTAYFLIATSAPPCQATAETVMLTSRTTCGPDTPVTVSVDTACRVTISDTASGLPASGNVGYESKSQKLVQTDVFLQTLPDAGFDEHCVLDPNDAGTGWDVTCTTCTGDAGCECGGTLSP